MQRVPDYLEIARRAAHRTHCAESSPHPALDQERDGLIATEEEAKLEDVILKDALTVDEARAEMSRPNSGSALARATYLDKPNDERLQWLTKAVLRARGMDAGDWRRHAGAVKEAAGDSKKTNGEE